MTNTIPPHLINSLPAGFEVLADLALDLRWTWNHSADRLWQKLDPVLWQLTENPWLILQSVSSERLNVLSNDEEFKNELGRLKDLREEYLKKGKKARWILKGYQTKQKKEAYQ